MKAVRNNIITAAVLAAIGFAGCSSLMAQTVAYYPATTGYSMSYVRATPAQPTYLPVVASTPVASPVILAADQIDVLTAPIALYPDPLLAVLLPAATYPNDITAAATWLRSNPQPTDETVNAQPWDRSVKALVRYPTVLQQLADNMDWTQALGSAFINQERDVMESIQRLRAKAQAQGNLSDNTDQTIVADQGAIQILPTSADYIYVPVYDPGLVYSYPYTIGYWGFGFGFFFNDFCCDWRHFHVRCGFDNRIFWNGSFRGGRVILRGNAVGLAAVSRPWVRDISRPAPIMPQRFVSGLSLGSLGAVNSMAGRMPSWNRSSATPTFRAPQVKTPSFSASSRAMAPTFRSQPQFESPQRSVPASSFQGESMTRSPSSLPVYRGESTPSFRSAPAPASSYSAPAFRSDGGWGGSFSGSAPSYGGGRGYSNGGGFGGGGRGGGGGGHR
ncbi:MAG: DUF3300 domain-containing protein [Phycisphaerales bacterium]|nr:DUF3300 domain-containing protein [Phycisphaerales bacterium]